MNVISNLTGSCPVKTRDVANHLLKCFEINRHIDIQDVYTKLIKSDKYYNHVRLNGLDYPDCVPHGKSEWLRIYHDSRVFILENHLDCIRRMVGDLDIIALIAQYTVDAFYENGIMRAQKDFIHGIIIMSNSSATKKEAG